MGYLTKEKILAADDVKTVDVELPEWGGSVKVRGMTGRMRGNLENKIAANAPHSDIKMMIVLECTLDGEGNKLFSSKDKADLQEKAAGPIEKIFNAACDLSGIKDHAVEEAEGN